MASPFSSSDIDDSAIESMIAEVTDLCTLEQIAALNTAHLSDTPLPSNLDTRFQKLKSFPGTTDPQCTNEERENIPRSLNRCDSEPGLFEDPKHEQAAKPEVRTSPEIREQKPRSGSSSVGSPKESPSPPRKICCFGCFLKRIQRRGNNIDDEILSEFGSSALKDHRRKLKKAWREHEKASQEAEKIVKWVKQVSMRINEAAIDELLKEEFK